MLEAIGAPSSSSQTVLSFVLVLLLMSLRYSGVEGSNNTLCTAWTTGTSQNVTVDGVLLLLGSECNTHLADGGVNVTLYCSPGALVVIRGLVMRGGYVAVMGPQASPWLVVNVTLTVTDSVMDAIEGPAVGVVLVSPPPSSSTTTTVQNVSLTCLGSALSSTSRNASASALSVVPDATFAATDAVGVYTLTIVAVNCTLQTATPWGAVSSVAGVSLNTASDFTAHAVTILLGRVTAAATAAQGHASVASITAATVTSGSTGRVLLWDIFGQLSFVNATAVAASSGTSAVAVGGVALVIPNSVTISNVTLFTESSLVNCSNRATANQASAIVGLAIGRSANAATISNLSMFMKWTNATCTANATASFVASTGSGMATAVASFALGVISSTAMVANVTAVIAWSYASCVVLGGKGTAGVSIAGIAVGGSSLSTLNTSNALFFVQGSNVTCQLSNAGSFVALSVAGVATSSSSTLTSTYAAFFTINGSTVSSVVEGGSNAVSTVAGLAAISTSPPSPVNTANMTTFVGWSAVTCSSNGQPATLSSVAGVAVSSTPNRVSIQGLSMVVEWSAVNCFTVGTSDSASTVAGVSVSALTQPNVTTSQLVAFVSHANITCASKGSLSRSSSSVAGVAVSYSSFINIDNMNSFVGSSNVTCEATTNSLSNMIASTIAGAAMGPTTAVAISSTVGHIATSNASSASTGRNTVVSSVATWVVGTTVKPSVVTASWGAAQSTLQACVNGSSSLQLAVVDVNQSTASCYTGVYDAATGWLPPASPAVPTLPVAWPTTLFLTSSTPIAAYTRTKLRATVTRRATSWTPSRSLSREASRSFTVTRRFNTTSTTPSRSEGNTASHTEDALRLRNVSASLGRRSATHTVAARPHHRRTTTRLHHVASRTRRRSSTIHAKTIAHRPTKKKTSSPTVEPSLTGSATDEVTLTADTRAASTTVTMSGTATFSASRLQLKPVSQPSVVSATTVAVQTTTSSIAVTSAVASIGSGASGANAGRINVLLKLATCSDGTDGEAQDPLDRTSHPLGFGVSAAGSAVQYDAGLVLGDTALGVIVALLHFGVTVVRRNVFPMDDADATEESRGESVMWRAAMWTRFPGLSTTVHLYLLPLIAQSATSCLVRGARVGVVIGMWGWFMTVAIIAVLLYCTVFKLANSMECNTPIVRDAGSGELWLLRAKFEWTAKTSQHSTEMLCTCFGAYFEDYVFSARWWLCVEIITAVASGMAGGLAGTATCLSVQILAVVPNAVYLLLLLLVRPHQRRLDFGASSTVGVLLLASSVAACTGSTSVATGAALAASVVGFVPALAAPYKLVQQIRNIHSRRKLRRAERNRKREAQASSLLVVPAAALVADAVGDDDNLWADFLPSGHAQRPEPQDGNTVTMAEDQVDDLVTVKQRSIGSVLQALDRPRGAAPLAHPAASNSVDTELEALLLGP